MYYYYYQFQFSSKTTITFNYELNQQPSCQSILTEHVRLVLMGTTSTNDSITESRRSITNRSNKKRKEKESISIVQIRQHCGTKKITSWVWIQGTIRHTQVNVEVTHLRKKILLCSEE